MVCINGQPSFITALSNFIERRCENDIRPSNVDSSWKSVPDESNLFTTHGISHGVDLICACFLRPGEVVVVENLTYFLMGQIFRDHGLDIITAPTDEYGLNITAFRLMLEDRKSRNEKLPKMLYTIPTNANPSATTLPISRREELLELGKEYGFFIVADEVYHLLDWHDVGKRPSRFAAIDFAKYGQESKEGNSLQGPALTGPEAKQDHDKTIPDIAGRAISVNAFTKILAPGVRGTLNQQLYM